MNRHSRILALSAALCLAVFAGCGDGGSSAYFVVNTVPEGEFDKEIAALNEQLAKATPAERDELNKKIKESREEFEARQKFVNTALVSLFGTPDEPVVLPEAKLNDAKIRLAAGPASAGPKGNTGGLYRQHCVHCHGVTGDGAGPTAEFLNPFPRDFRHGNFKFKATAIGEKPTQDDLYHIISTGINGTAMPSFKLLPKAEIEALAEYVKYLSIRGQMETALHAKYTELELGKAKDDADKGLVKVEELRTWLVENKETIAWDEDAKDKTPKLAEVAKPIVAAAEKGTVELVQFLGAEGLKPEAYEGNKKLVALVTAGKEGAAPVAEFRASLLDLVLGEEVMMKWNRAAESIVPVLPRPDVTRAVSIQKGRDLFYGRAACVKCHGDSAQGDGQFFIHNDPKYADQLKPLVNPKFKPPDYEPQILRPRNLRYASIRGGHRDQDLYRRLYNGIDNVGMPGLHGTPGITDEEIWHVVDYVQSLPYEAEFIALPTAENTRAN